MTGSKSESASVSAATTLAALVEHATGESPARDGIVDRDGSVSPADRLADAVAPADSVVGVVPRIDPSLLERIRRRDASSDGRGDASSDGHEEISGDGREDVTSAGVGDAALDARIVVTGRARQQVTGPAEPLVRSLLADSDGIELLVHDGDPPVSFLLIDDRAAVGIFDDAGLAAVLVADDPATREWVATVCRRYLSTADSLPL